MVSMKEGRTPSFSFPGANGPEKRLGEKMVQNPFWDSKSGYLMTSTRHIPTGRVVENRRAFQDHIFDSLSSAMEMRHDGSNIGLALLFHCSHALFMTVILF